MLNPSVSYTEHAEDVLSTWLEWRTAGPVALIVLTSTTGGGVRAPGALMAVSDSGVAGYVSGGCVDEDVALQARQALQSGEQRELRYGAGSPYLDLPLPCGGAIELTILPDADPAVLSQLKTVLTARRRAVLTVGKCGGLTAGEVSDAQTPTSDSLSFVHTPKLRLRIAGRGADCLALARLATAGGIAVDLLLRDGEFSMPKQMNESLTVRRLTAPTQLPEIADDDWTAFVMMFHDADWETPLLAQALAGPAFYVGAVGSRNTHDKRRRALADAGLKPVDVNRARGPIGLIPAMRDASMLAASVLAEIVDAYHIEKASTFRKTALLLLAAGDSSRFEGGDKLLADFGGRPLLTGAASLLSFNAVGARIAVAESENTEKTDCLTSLGWDIAVNKNPEQGMGSSIAAGVAQIKMLERIDSVLILLGDMPLVQDSHLAALKRQLTADISAVMTEANGVLSPPALFKRDAFGALGALSGDFGARQLFRSMTNTQTVALSKAHALDIDNADALETAKAQLVN